MSPSEMPLTAVKQESKPVEATAPEPWHMSSLVLQQHFAVKPRHGLDSAEATRRLARVGANALRTRERQSVLSIIGGQFASLIVLLLLVAAAVAALFGQYLEALAIAVVLLFNGAIGFLTEWHAVREMDALRALGQMQTTVRRDGEVSRIDAAAIVPGDIVLLEGGDVVTADARVLTSSRLQVDQSMLTGESAPVDKGDAPVPIDTPVSERGCMLYRGTSISRGSVEALVTATGMHTELGRIADLVVAHEEEKTPLERKLDRLGHRLVYVSIFIALVIVVSGVFTGRDPVLLVQTALALAVAAIPEGLPIVATIALAHGMQTMARHRALMTRLGSVETLGSTGVICTDKTGTLTENRMSVASLALTDGRTIEPPLADAAMLHTDPLTLETLQLGALCNNAQLGDPSIGDPLEIALLEIAAEAGLQRANLEVEQPRRREWAFDPETRMMATLHVAGDVRRIAVKGAPEAVIAACRHCRTADGSADLDEHARANWLAVNDRLAATGLRVIAIATQQTTDPISDPYADLCLVALIGLRDPPRQDVAGAISACHEAGVRVVMVTGDHPATALGIARATGIVSTTDATVLAGRTLAQSPSSTDLARERERAILSTNVFARVAPAEKLMLIEAHQRAGHIVAMTGDGVNDAPALQKADIGVAMGLRGTQVAREAADIVLEDDAFPTIVTAIHQGRIIFENIRNVVFYLLSCNVGEVIVVATAVILGLTLPLLPLQILFLNLVTDVFPALALGLGRGNAGLMAAPPRPPTAPILSASAWRSILLFGASFAVAVIGALVFAERWLDLDAAKATSVSFLTLAFAQLWHVFNLHGRHEGFLNNAITRNGWVWGAIALCIALVISAILLPPVAAALSFDNPGSAGWSVALAASTIPWIVGRIPQLRPDHVTSEHRADASATPQGRKPDPLEGR